MSTTTDIDVEAFALHVAKLQHEHNTRSEEYGAMRSAAAIRSWGAKVPPALDLCLRDRLVAEHRDAWLRDAEATIRTLDHKAFTTGTFHVIDGREIGMPERGFLGLSYGAHLHVIARDCLPRRARNPVAAVAVHVEAVARNTVDTICHARDAAVQKIRAAIAAVAAHEYAHHAVAVAAGEPLKDGVTLEQLIDSLAGAVHKPAHRSRTHGPAWCRAYAHLVTRAAFLPAYAVWIDRFRDDVKAAQAGDPDAMLDALHPELVRCTADDPIVDIIRSPAPAGFLKLFDAMQGANHASDS